MKRDELARELVKVAKMLIGIEFDSQDAFDKYMKEHPDADKSNHSVKKSEKKQTGRKLDLTPNEKGMIEVPEKVAKEGHDIAAEFSSSEANHRGLLYQVSDATHSKKKKERAKLPELKKKLEESDNELEKVKKKVKSFESETGLDVVHAWEAVKQQHWPYAVDSGSRSVKHVVKK